MEVPSDSVIESSCKECHGFAMSYYKHLDTNRNSISSIITPDARIIYNGNPLAGGKLLQELYMAMPPTRHSVLNLDCHPLVQSSTMMVVVSGNVRFKEDRRDTCGFSDSLLLRRDPATNKLQVLSSCYRITFRSTESAVML